MRGKPEAKSEKTFGHENKAVPEKDTPMTKPDGFLPVEEIVAIAPRSWTKQTKKGDEIGREGNTFDGGVGPTRRVWAIGAGKTELGVVVLCAF